MVEVGAIAINAVMTCQAILSIIQDVLDDIAGLKISMAAITCLPLERDQGVWMAVLALKVIAIVIGHVSG